MITKLHDHVTILHDHITILHDHITILHGHITVLHDHITILHSHIIIPGHEIMRSQNQSKAQGQQASFHATARPPQGPTSKHWVPSSKSAHIISKKICDSRKKMGPRGR